MKLYILEDNKQKCIDMSLSEYLDISDNVKFNHSDRNVFYYDYSYHTNLLKVAKYPISKLDILIKIQKASNYKHIDIYAIEVNPDYLMVMTKNIETKTVYDIHISTFEYYKIISNMIKETYFAYLNNIGYHKLDMLYYHYQNHCLNLSDAYILENVDEKEYVVHIQKLISDIAYHLSTKTRDEGTKKTLLSISNKLFDEPYNNFFDLFSKYSNIPHDHDYQRSVLETKQKMSNTYIKNKSITKTYPLDMDKELTLIKAMSDRYSYPGSKIYEINISDSSIYTEEEFIKGYTLSRYINNQNYTLDDIIEISISICPIITYFHDEKLLIRDLKPDNIIVAYNECYLVDYDAVVCVNKDNIKPVGTIGYASIEHHSKATYKSDIYSFGVIINSLINNIENDIDEDEKNYKVKLNKLTKLTTKMLSINEDKRPNISTIKYYLDDISNIDFSYDDTDEYEFDPLDYEYYS